MCVQRLHKRLGFHDIRVVAGAMVKRVDACCQARLVGMHDQWHADLGHRALTVRNHLAEFPGSVDVQQRKRRHCRIKRLARQVQQNR